MTDEEMRIALAEWRGWKWTPPSENNGIVGYWKNPDGFQVSWGIDKYLRLKACGGTDYLNDLNAVHELEKRLTPAQRLAYVRALFYRQSAGIGGHVSLMPAAQRCEALLKTLNLWKGTQ